MWAASYTREDDRGTEAPVSLDALYRAHAPVVARWAAHLGGPSLDVQDAVHEIFLIVRRRLPEFRGESKPTTWLYRITAKTLIVWGRDDVLIPPVYGDAFKKAISKSKLVRIAKAGHAVGQEKPAAVLKAIRDFF